MVEVFVFRFATRLRRVALFFEPARRHLPVLNIGLAVLAWVANTYWIQAFCQPVAWASGALIAGTTAFLVWPWLARANAGVRYGALFLQGLFFTICLYCTWFMGTGYLLLGLLFCWSGLPALAWLPVFFGVQVLRRVRGATVRGRWLAFGLGAFSLTPVLWWADVQYREMQTVLARMPLPERQDANALLRVLPRSYMVERVAGTAWRYHTEPEFIYDGWRPPLHDPLLVICLNLHGRGGMNVSSSPLTLADDVADNSKFFYPRANFYHRLFPANPIKPDCVCAHNDDGEFFRRWVPTARE